ncbi:MAG TPA: hypothetical protein VII69_06210 [Candidatus Eremiobacteraceae bacterium]
MHKSAPAAESRAPYAVEPAGTMPFLPIAFAGGGDDNGRRARALASRSQAQRGLARNLLFSVHTTGVFAVDMCISKSRKP